MVDRDRPRRIRFSLPTRTGRVLFDFRVSGSAGGGDSPPPDLSPARSGVEARIVILLAFLFFGVLLNFIAVKSVLLAVRSVEATAVVTEVAPSAKAGVPPTVRVWFADRQRRSWTAELHPTHARTVGQKVEVVYDRDDPAEVEDARYRHRELLRMLGVAAGWWLIAPWVLRTLGLRVPRQARPVALGVGALVVLVWVVVLLLR